MLVVRVQLEGAKPRGCWEGSCFSSDGGGDVLCLKPAGREENDESGWPAPHVQMDFDLLFGVTLLTILDLDVVAPEQLGERVAQVLLFEIGHLVGEIEAVCFCVVIVRSTSLATRAGEMYHVTKVQRAKGIETIAVLLVQARGY